MSDIFISYSSADRERARLFAQAFEQRGWSVWWDREIPPGRAYDDVIEEALGAAKCVVVLWSKTATASGWVKNEASDAMQRKVLIPALIDADLKIPLEFRRLQAADLSRWQGEASPEFEQFCDAIARNVGGDGPSPQPQPQPVPRPAPAPQPFVPPAPPPGPVPPVKARSSKAMWIGIGVGVLVLGGIASMVSEQQADRHDPVGPRGNVAPTPAPSQDFSAAAGPGMALSFRDHALTYQGRFTMNGVGSPAHLSIDVHDGKTGRSLGHRELDAYGHADAPGRNVFAAQVEVDGDSVTPGRHVHTVNLVFEQRPDGSWPLVRNCSAPGDCYDVPH